MGTKIASGKRLNLWSVDEGSDFRYVYRWRNQKTFKEMCTRRQYDVTYEEFVVELNDDFALDRDMQVIGWTVHRPKPVMTAFSYHYSEHDGHLFVTVYVDDVYQDEGYGAEGFILFVEYLMRVRELYKFYCDVYSGNTHSIALIRRAGLTEEGRLYGHRLTDGVRYDLLRFAGYRTLLPRLQRYIDHCQSATQ